MTAEIVHDRNVEKLWQQLVNAHYLVGVLGDKDQRAFRSGLLQAYFLVNEITDESPRADAVWGRLEAAAEVLRASGEPAPAPFDPSLPPQPVTISSVVAGRHPDGAKVIVTGVANGIVTKKTKQGNPWAEFWLSDQRTAVRVQLLPRPYRDYKDLFTYHDKDGALRPAPLTVTGKVGDGGQFMSMVCPSQPQVIAEHITRAEGLVKRGEWIALEHA